MAIRKLPGTFIGNQTTGDVIYTPPTGEDVIRDLLTNWEHSLHTDDGLDPLIKMAISHYQFEAIHPFYDGNGRTGRLLNQVSKDQNWEEWLLFMLKGVEQTAIWTCDKITAIRKLMESTTDYIKVKVTAPRPKR